MQCQADGNADWFWHQLAITTGGQHLHLQDFGHMVDFLFGICYKEQGDTFFQVYTFIRILGTIKFITETFTSIGLYVCVFNGNEVHRPILHIELLLYPSNLSCL